MPNVVSVCAVAPLFLYVGWSTPETSLAYVGLLVVAAALLVSIVADLHSGTTRLTGAVAAYLCLGIPLLVYLGVRRDASGWVPRRLLGVMAVVYAWHHVRMLHTRPSTFAPSGLPRHPLRRGVFRCDAAFKRASSARTSTSISSPLSSLATKTTGPRTSLQSRKSHG